MSERDANTNLCTKTIMDDKMDYKVSFFKLTYEENPERNKKPAVVGQEPMGFIVVDDSGDMPLASKAFRRATETQQLCQKVVIEKL